MATVVQSAIRWNPPRLLLAALLVLAALASGYGIAQVRASHTDPNEVHLCVNPNTKQVIYVQNPAQCVNGSVVTVNKQGVPGPQGPVGPAGPAGPPGPAGIEAGDFVERVSDPVLVELSQTGSATAHCEDGEVAVGGGYIVEPGYFITVRVNARSGSTGWFVDIFNSAPGDDVNLRATVICAQL
jgi:hypothetical protein